MYGSYDHMKSVAILAQACLERAPFCPELSAFPFASSHQRSNVEPRNDDGCLALLRGGNYEAS